jgi:hypothetical protein
MSSTLVVSQAAAAAEEEEEEAGLDEEEKCIRRAVRSEMSKIGYQVERSIVFPLLLLPLVVALQYAMTVSFDLLYEGETHSMRVAWAWITAIGLLAITALIYWGCSNDKKPRKAARRRRMLLKRRPVDGDVARS